RDRRRRSVCSSVLLDDLRQIAETGTRLLDRPRTGCWFVGDDGVLLESEPSVESGADESADDRVDVAVALAQWLVHAVDDSVVVRLFTVLVTACAVESVV